MTTTDTPTPKTPTPKRWYAKKRHMLWYIPTLAFVALMVLAANTPAPSPVEPAVAAAQPAAQEPQPEPDSGDICDADSDAYDPQACAVGMNIRADEANEPKPDPIIEEELPITEFTIGDGVNIETDGSPSETITVKQLEYSTTPYDEYGSGPKHKTFLIFTVRVDAVASTSVYEDDFYIVTKDGERFDHGAGNSYDAVDFDDMLGYAELNAGQHKTGVLVFDSPVKHGELAYDPNYEGEPIATWEF